jgi:sugar/nucleoside kinase (ribokinase family)
VVTRGAGGADIYRAGEEPLHIDAAPATPVDTTGAGDAFAAAFSAALACGAGDAQAGALAARVAAATVEHAGAVLLPRVAMPEGVAG